MCKDGVLFLFLVGFFFFLFSFVLLFFWGGGGGRGGCGGEVLSSSSAQKLDRVVSLPLCICSSFLPYTAPLRVCLLGKN